MREFNGGKKWRVTASPNKVRLTERLSNGQYLSMWFWRRRVKGGDDQILYIWTVGLYIGDRKGASHWRRNKAMVKQTGTCGMEGLAIALDTIKAFTANFGYREELQIMHSDIKRHRAYKYLLRYPGFTIYSYGNKQDARIAFRIPDYWEWVPNKGADEE